MERDFSSLITQSSSSVCQGIYESFECLSFWTNIVCARRRLLRGDRDEAKFTETRGINNMLFT